MRHVVLAAVLVASLQPGASAEEGVYPFEGTMSADCFGCGTSAGHGEHCVVSKDSSVCVYHRALHSPNTWSEFTTNEPGGTCPVTGSASGYMYGALNVDFTWTRLGNVLVITTAGQVNGAGTAVVHITEPVGNPCGGPVTMLVVGQISGL
jgi:hypothetical protein